MRLANSVLSLLLGLAALAAGAQQADPASDAPEQRFTAPSAVPPPTSYPDALARWRTPEDVNAWIGAHFQYDMARALQLSETQRARNGRMPILAPDAFFAQPAGVCVDLSRFAVETLRTTAPQTRPAYLMIEFDVDWSTMTFLTVSDDALPWWLLYSAANPATCGDAIEVPVPYSVLVSLSFQADRMFRPGA